MPGLHSFALYGCCCLWRLSSLTYPFGLYLSRNIVNHVDQGTTHPAPSSPSLWLLSKRKCPTPASAATTPSSLAPPDPAQSRDISANGNYTQRISISKKTRQPPDYRAEPHTEVQSPDKLGHQQTKRRNGNKPPMQIPQRQVPAHGREPEDLAVQRLAPRRHLGQREVPAAVARVEHGGDVVEGGLDRRRRRRLRAEEGDEVDGDVEVLFDAR